MSKTLLITGASSGIGRAVAEFFAGKGWNVAATMRNPEADKALNKFQNLKKYRLDVTDNSSIDMAVQAVIADFGKIDVLVNNAGYGAVGAFEKATDTQLQKQFDVNVFGVFKMIRHVLPHFRQHKAGMIINITSVGGRLTFPLYSAYHATKWAVEGFGESLQYELRPFNIKIKNVEPGAIKTDFYDRSQDLFKNDAIKAYDAYEKTCLKNMQDTGKNAAGPLVVAKVVWKAANSTSGKLRYIAGTDAKMLLLMRRLLPLNRFMQMVGSVVEKGFKKQR